MRKTEKAPTKTGWMETDKGQTGKPMCARWGREGILDTCKTRVVRLDAAAGGAEIALSEAAKGKRRERVLALVDVRRAYFYRRRAFVKLPPDDYQAVAVQLVRHARRGTNLGDLDLERANHAATPRTVERKKEDNGRSDGSKEENQCEKGQRQAKHDWDDAGDDEDKNRAQMTSDERDDVNYCQALTGGDITKYTALAARNSYLSQDRPDLKFASVQVFCAMANPPVFDMERAKRIGMHLVGMPRAECLFHRQQSGELEAYSDSDW